MSLIAKYLKSLRTRRNLTDLKIAQRANMDLEELYHIERNPEQVPVSRLYELLKALKITGAEFAELSHIIYCMLYKKKASPPSPNVLQFKSKKGLNSRRKKKLTRKTDKEI